MKRILFFLLAAILAVGGGLAYLFLADTPEKVLRDGMTSLVSMRGVSTAKLDVSWTNSRYKTTTGITFTGALDLRDPVLPNVSGLLRVGAGSSGPLDQTGDIVAAGEDVALRPRTVGPDWRAAYEALVGITSTKPYVRFERATLLEALEHPGVMTEEGKGEDLRKALAFLVPLAVPVGPIINAQSSLGPLAIVDFKFDRAALSPFLRNLLKAWYGRNPTVEELGLIDKLIQGPGKATYRLTITKDTRKPVQLSGKFGTVDDLGKPTPITVEFNMGFQGVDEVSDIVMPEGNVDALIGMQGAQAKITLPSAKAATGTNLGMEAIGEKPSFGDIVGNKQIDLYEKYLDTLKKRKVKSVKKR